MLAAAGIYPEIPTVIDVDQGNRMPACQSAIEIGFTGVMMDGSLMEDGATPSSFENNGKVTREVVEVAHVKGVTVEGEIGCPGCIEDGYGACAMVESPDRPRSGSGIRAAGRSGRVGHRPRHQPRRIQVKFGSQPAGATLKMERLIEIPAAAACRTPGDARFVPVCLGAAGHHKPVRAAS
jgi:fructose-bisphosphate aldolase class II